MRLFRPQNDCAPPGWETLTAQPIVQMAANNPALPPLLAGEREILPLGPSNIAEMLELAKLTSPGPLAPRTPLLGRYIDMRDSVTGQLVMGGERFSMPGYIELSAIAVHPEARGRGLGAAVTVALAHAAFARGETPFLHVYGDNPAASLYPRLGFCDRRTLWVLQWRRLTPGKTE